MGFLKTDNLVTSWWTHIMARSVWENIRKWQRIVESACENVQVAENPNRYRIPLCSGRNPLIIHDKLTRQVVSQVVHTCWVVRALVLTSITKIVCDGQIRENNRNCTHTELHPMWLKGSTTCGCALWSVHHTQFLCKMRPDRWARQGFYSRSHLKTPHTTELIFSRRFCYPLLVRFLYMHG